MQTLIPMDDFGVFVDKQDTVRVDSRFVAQFFEKRHDLVLRDIRNLDCSENFRLLNFEESTYINEQGHKQPCYVMTRDGFVFLAMGYRGKRAAQFKELYIHRFNEMEAFIKTLVSARQEFPLLTENIRLLKDDPKPYHFQQRVRYAQPHRSRYDCKAVPNPARHRKEDQHPPVPDAGADRPA